MRVASTLSTMPSRARDDAHAGVARELAFHARADERRVRADERHGLTLHVRAHERAVGVVVLEERNERGGDRHHLVRRDVHELDHVGRDHAGSRRCSERETRLSRNLPFSSMVGRGLGDVLALLFERRVPVHLVGDAGLRRRVRYGVSTKPYSLTRANVDSDAMRPMFGPSGVSIGQIRP